MAMMSIRSTAPAGRRRRICSIKVGKAESCAIPVSRRYKDNLRKGFRLQALDRRSHSLQQRRDRDTLKLMDLAMNRNCQSNSRRILQFCVGNYDLSAWAADDDAP